MEEFKVQLELWYCSAHKFIEKGWNKTITYTPRFNAFMRGPGLVFEVGRNTLFDTDGEGIDLFSIFKSLLTYYKYLV